MGGVRWGLLLVPSEPGPGRTLVGNAGTAAGPSRSEGKRVGEGLHHGTESCPTPAVSGYPASPQGWGEGTQAGMRRGGRGRTGQGGAGWRERVPPAGLQEEAISRRLWWPGVSEGGWRQEDTLHLRAELRRQGVLLTGQPRA